MSATLEPTPSESEPRLRSAPTLARPVRLGPEAWTPLPRRLSAVMFTDVVGYTALMQEDEEAARIVRVRHRHALEAAIARHGGELVQYLGDGSLSTFPSTVRAVSAAVEIQQTLADDVPLRIGINQGEIAFDEQGIYGDCVNIAARVMGLGIAGSVIVSEKAHDELKNQRDYSTSTLGRFDLRNVRHPLEIHAIANEGLEVPTRGDLLAATQPHRERLPWGLVVGALVLATALIADLALNLHEGLSLESSLVDRAFVVASIWFLFDKVTAAMAHDTRKHVSRRLPEMTGRASRRPTLLHRL